MDRHAKWAYDIVSWVLNAVNMANIFLEFKHRIVLTNNIS